MLFAAFQLHSPHFWIQTFHVPFNLRLFDAICNILAAMRHFWVRTSDLPWFATVWCSNCSWNMEMFSLGLVLNSLKIFFWFLLRLALSFVHVGFRIRVWLRYIYFFACA
jgi:hypothetical protein